MTTRGAGQTPLRILHVIASLAAEEGGPPVVCAGLAAATAARGHRVTIATLDEPGRASVNIPANVDVKRFPHDRGTAEVGRYHRSRPLALWLREQAANYDIAHLHSLWLYPTFAAAQACWRWRVPYVVLPNGMLDVYSVTHHSYWIKRLYWMLRESRIESRARGIHCLNRAEIRRAVPWIRDLPKFIVGNAIAAADLMNMPARGRFRAAHPELATAPIALFLSRIHPKKGLDRLIPAWKSFIERVPTGKLVIAGSGDKDYTAEIDNLILTHHMQNHILRIGQLNGPSKWEALVDADVFVLPSHQEGFSMAITEALAAGCPAVVTAECNFDELREHQCGIVIDHGDMSVFVQSAAELTQPSPRRSAMTAAGQKLVSDRYTWEQIAEDLERVYRWICADHPLLPSGDDVWRQTPPIPNH